MVQLVENKRVNVQEEEIVVFSLAGKEYGINVKYVTSIEKITFITRVPNTKPYIKGVMNLRGIIVPIIDLRTRFGLEETHYTEKSRILIISFEDITVGLIVDAANDVIKITESNVEAQPEVIGVEKQNYIQGVVHLQDRLIILLHLHKILNLSGEHDEHEA